MDDVLCTTSANPSPSPTAAQVVVAPLPAPADLATPASRAGLQDVRKHLVQLHAEGRHDEALMQVMSLLVRLFDDNKQLQVRIAALLKAQFGRRSEQISAHQLDLFLKELENSAGQEDGATDQPNEPVDADLYPPPEPEPEPPQPQRRPGRNKLPDHLPHKRHEILVPEQERPCPVCGKERACIGHEVSEQLDFVPASFVVNVFEREKLACRVCEEHVVVAPKVCKVITGGLCGAGMLAHVLVCKYQDHLPLYRQSEIYQRQGVTVAESTLCSWVGQTCGAKKLGRVAAEIWRQALACALLGVDDTGLPTLDPAHEKGIKRGHLWQGLGYDDQGKPMWPAFFYTEDWKKAGPERFLAGFTGKLQGDGYAGWAALVTAAAGLIVLFGCWAHARRKFVEALDAKEMQAAVPVALIRKLYAIEAEAREKKLNAAERQALREAEVPAILARLRTWLDEKRGKLRPKSKLYEAFTYLDNQWASLGRYVHDGQVPIDNNLVENRMRPVGLGRKNYLFAGADSGGERAAVAYTVLAACRIHRREPWGYLRDVLTALAERDEDASVVDLLPDRFGPLLLGLPAG